MKNKLSKLLISTFLSLAFGQNALASGQSEVLNQSNNIIFPAPPSKGDIHVTVEAFETNTCQKTATNKSFFLGTGVIIDIAIGIVGNLLEAQKDGLQASYSGGLTKKFVQPIKCIKVERKKVISLGTDNSPNYDSMPLMSLELLIDDADLHGSANRLALKNLIVREPAPSKSKVKYDTRLNYAITVGFTIVDDDGKERAFSRNLSLIPSVPLIGEFKKGKLIRDKVTYSKKSGERFESPIFAKLPDTNPYTATIAVSITETDARYDDAESISDFFSENSSIVDGILGDIFD